MSCYLRVVRDPFADSGAEGRRFRAKRLTCLRQGPLTGHLIGRVK